MLNLILTFGYLVSGVTTYVTYWKILQPFTWLFSVWAVLELFAVILEKLKGRATLGRSVQHTGFAVSTKVSWCCCLRSTLAAADAALTAVFGLCILTWLTLLNAYGEQVRVTVLRFTTEHEQRVLQQLDGVNEALLRLSKRQL